ncbi:MAG: Fe-S cluster assembly protein SufD [Candidatus Competibacteraceae bacterium]|nr:Fe-S cluster assembly protein SufD [Candidatus Competibacteraceae bacterium]
MSTNTAVKDISPSLTEKILSGLPNHLATRIFSSCPSSRNESWKYTPLHNWIEPILETPTHDGLIPQVKEGQNMLYFFNGKLIHIHLSSELENCIEVHPGQTDIQPDFPLLPEKDNNHFFTELASLAPHAGYLIRVKAETRPAANLHILYDWDGAHHVLNTLNHIVVEKNASLQLLVESKSSATTSVLHNQLTRIWLHEDASLTLYRMHNTSSGFSLIDELSCTVEYRARFHACQVTAGGGLIRNNYKVCLNGESADANLRALNILSGNTHADSHVTMIHQSPSCTSNQTFKSIVSQEATAVFSGTIHVERDAQKTNAFQSSRSILLGDKSRSYAKPRLEIYADDVKCSHGATTGQINQEALFYLQSRGISLPTARNMLIAAFASDVLTGIENEDYLQKAQALIENFTGVHEIE